jgi:hypothetical protein
MKRDKKHFDAEGNMPGLPSAKQIPGLKKGNCQIQFIWG